MMDRSVAAVLIVRKVPASHGSRPAVQTGSPPSIFVGKASPCFSDQLQFLMPPHLQGERIIRPPSASCAKERPWNCRRCSSDEDCVERSKVPEVPGCHRRNERARSNSPAEQAWAQALEAKFRPPLDG